jgi:hypothetical protein
LSNPAKLRRHLILLAAIYFLGIITAIKVLERRASAIGLLGLPIGLYFVWMYLRAAASLKP